MKTTQKRNWSQYNQRLKRQARLDLYVSNDIFVPYHGPRRPGGVLRYADALIEACLLVREYFSLALRQTQGFMESLAARLAPDLSVPDYTTLCRRSKRLQVELKPKITRLRQGAILAIDSTGLSLLSADSWNRHKHRKQRGNSSWHKLHLIIDTETGDILACEDTPATTNDCLMLPPLLNALEGPPPKAVCGDMAYDTFDCRKAIAQCGARQLIPPKRNAVACHPEHAHWKQRDVLQERDEAIGYFAANAVNGCDQLARKRWKQLVGYHRRSLAETTMSRLKTHTGTTLKTKLPQTKTTQCNIKCKLLNILNQA